MTEYVRKQLSVLCFTHSKQAKKALKSILQKCTYLPVLEPLLYDAPSNILKHVICQFSKVMGRYFLHSRMKNAAYFSHLCFLCFKVLPHDSKARRLFVTSGGLKKVQEIKAEPGSALQEYINAINNCYPEEIVRFMLIHTV